MPGHRGIFLLVRVRVCVCVCVCGWRGSEFQSENFPSSEETLKCHLDQTSTLSGLRCSIRQAETFWPILIDMFGFFFLLICSSFDYLETWVLCLCTFVSVFPLTLQCVAAGPGPVPVGQVSLCLCLLL